MSDTMRDLTREMRELKNDELESVGGGAQHPLGWPDGLPLPHP
jgi:hypothetical protein